MKFRQLITAASIAILPLAASAATFIVPAAGTGPGANDSRWQSELTLHNTSATPTTIGIYAVTAATVRWDLVHADGTPAASVEQSYKAGTQLQYGQGIKTLLGLEEQDDDAIHAVVSSGKVIAYGSAINNQSGDPTFVPGIRARVDIRLNFVGVDLNEDGIVDVFDANHDGVLDQPIDVFTTSGFPHYFRIVVTGPNGEPATLELVDTIRDAQFIDVQTLQYASPSTLKGSTGTLKVRATAAGVSEVITIPVNYR